VVDLHQAVRALLLLLAATGIMAGVLGEFFVSRAF
jgi:hypothetical protein